MNYFYHYYWYYFNDYVKTIHFNFSFVKHRVFFIPQILCFPFIALYSQNSSKFFTYFLIWTINKVLKGLWLWKKALGDTFWNLYWFWSLFIFVEFLFILTGGFQWQVWRRNILYFSHTQEVVLNNIYFLKIVRRDVWKVTQTHWYQAGCQMVGLGSEYLVWTSQSSGFTWVTFQVALEGGKAGGKGAKKKKKKEEFEPSLYPLWVCTPAGCVRAESLLHWAWCHH